MAVPRTLAEMSEGGKHGTNQRKQQTKRGRYGSDTQSVAKAAAVSRDSPRDLKSSESTL